MITLTLSVRPALLSADSATPTDIGLFPLWTKEEGRSDLEVQLFVRTAGDGAWDLDVTNILVP